MIALLELFIEKFYFAELVKDGTYKAVVDSEYRFDDVLEAYDKLLSKQVAGRVVINVGGLE